MPKAILALLTLATLAACEAAMTGGPETDVIDAGEAEIIEPTETEGPMVTP